MRIFLLNALVFASVITSCNNSCVIGYVNPSKLMQGYHGATAQHGLFQTKAKAWQQRIDSVDAELQVLSNKPATTRASREQALLRYRDAIQQQAQQENQRLTQAVLDEINAYLKQYGKEKGYTFILGATESGNVVYAAEGTDVSDDVLKGLNAQYDRQHSTPH